MLGVIYLIFNEGYSATAGDDWMRPQLCEDDALTSEPLLQNYHLLPSARAEFLTKLGRLEEARVELERAASLTRDARERELLLERAAACARALGRPSS